MSLPYWKHFPQDYLHDARILKLNYEDRGIYWQVVNEMWSSEMRLPDDDEYMSILLRMPVEAWITAKKRIMSGTIPLIHSKGGFLMSDKFMRLHENAEAYSLAQSLKRAKNAQRKVARLKG